MKGCVIFSTELPEKPTMRYVPEQLSAIQAPPRLEKYCHSAKYSHSTGRIMDSYISLQEMAINSKRALAWPFESELKLAGWQYYPC